MKIQFEQAGANQNIEKRRTTTSHREDRVQRIGTTNGYALDISGIVMDNSAYKGQGKTAEDVMQEAGQFNVAVQKNYMAVMSNCMSAKDFSALCEEGFHPGNTDVETMVTIMDRIKAVLVQSGVEVVGYTDTLPMDVLTEIAGSESLARQMSDMFREQDVPLTAETAEAVCQTLKEAQSLTGLNDGTLKYMVQNSSEPTVDDTYRAQFSAAREGNRQGRGYYQDDAGYYARKADDISWDQLEPQIDRIIEEAGLSDNKNAKEYARWLVEEGIPLTKETLEKTTCLKEIDFSGDEKELLRAIAGAVSDGKAPGQANLADGRSLWYQAAEISKMVESIPKEAADRAAADGKPLTIRSLRESWKSLVNGDSGQVKENIAARRQLEEVRLQMTIQANRELLKSGYAIETAELEDLVQALKDVEDRQNQALYGVEDVGEASKRASLYQETLKAVSGIPKLPVAVVGRISTPEADDTLGNVDQEGRSLKAWYEKAGQSYETFQTAPRADLGDSIKKAFRNTDELLAATGLEISEENRRAVRILGYNSMEITAEQIEMVKEADQALKNVERKLTPAAVLAMIRDGKNPLTMSIRETDDYLSGQDRQQENEAEKFSKFLFKLEQKKEITQEEKASYIGIYRLLRQIQKSDGAVIGSLINQGAELTFSNLLTAVRTKRLGGIHAVVDDAFGTLEQLEGSTASISEQIAGAFRRQDEEGQNPSQKDPGTEYYVRLLREVYDRLDGQKLDDMSFQKDMTWEELADKLAETSEDSSLEESYLKETILEMRQVQNVENRIIDTLITLKEPVTVHSVLAAGQFLQAPSKAFDKLYRKAQEQEFSGGKQGENWKDALERIGQSFTDRESAGRAYTEMEKTAQEITQTAVFDDEGVTSLDVREMNLLYKQISIASHMAQEESYEVPVLTGDTVTAVHLQIVHSEEESGRVEAYMETESAGRVTASFQLDGEQVSGFLAYSEESGTGFMVQIKEKMEAGFAGMGLTEKEMHLTRSNGIKQPELKFSGQREENSKVSTKQLYAIARTFITAVREITDKERIAYEN